MCLKDQVRPSTIALPRGPSRDWRYCAALRAAFQPKVAPTLISRNMRESDNFSTCDRIIGSTTYGFPTEISNRVEIVLSRNEEQWHTRKRNGAYVTVDLLSD